MRFFYGKSSLEGINFSFKGEKKKALKESYEGKGLSADEVLLTGFEKYHLSTACRFCSLEERNEKSCCLLCLCACYLLFVPRYQRQDC